MAKVVRKNTLTSDLEKNKISDAYELFLASRKSQCAERTYFIYCDLGKRHIIPMLTSLTTGYMEDISVVALRTIVNDYGADHNEGGVFFLHRHIKAFLNWYWDEYSLDIPNPITKVKVKKPHPKPKHGITREEIEKLLKATKECAFPERDAVMIMILSDTGIRLSSLIGLKMKDIDLSKGQLTVFEKDQNYHIKTYGMTCAKAIKKYLNCLVDTTPDDSFWLKLDGTPLTESGMKEALRTLCGKAKIELHLFHDFRRFYGLELYKTTHDIYFVSRALDHKDIEVTKRYLAIDAIEDAEAMRAMSPMDNNSRIKIKRR